MTPSAANRICKVMNNNSDLGNKFRVYVTGGGCSGFQYGFKFDSEIAFDDDVVDFDNFSVLLDSMSYPYLYGSTLDFVEDLSGLINLQQNLRLSHISMDMTLNLIILKSCQNQQHHRQKLSPNQT